MLNKSKLSALALAIAGTVTLAAPAHALNALTDTDSLELKLRTIYFDRDYSKDSLDDSTFAQGMELNYQSGVMADWFRVGGSVYGVVNINSTGSAQNNILPAGSHDDSVKSGFTKIGQLYVDLMPVENSQIRIGAQKTKNMLLASSGSRAIPSTYRGVTAQYQFETVRLYAYAFDKWSKRHDNDWDDFETTKGKQIDLVWGIGAQYKQGKWNAEFEYLTSQDYLTKMGLRGSYTDQLAGGKLKLSGGYFTSEDDGDLFVAGVDSGNLDGIDENDGSVYYLDADWKYDIVSLGLAYSATDEIWIEDNFAGDHGTNPLPTRAPIGPDMTNANETVWQARLGLDLKMVTEGLSTKFTYTDGRDAENALCGSTCGKADEKYWALDTRYQMPMVAGLSMRYLYLDYDASETGSIAGVKNDEKDHRIYLDYAVKF